jgi:2-polyprenyl-3-methyl-5-hydroxy-6-metoxy-1,4-benzoquinol methylase
LFKINNQDFEAYANIKCFNYNIAETWMRLIDDIFKKSKRDICDIRILDYGCGDGKYYPCFINYGIPASNIYGVDVSRIRIERCKKIGWENVFSIDNDPILPFEDNYFDIVNIMEVIEHIPKQIINSCMKEISRVIDKSGVMILSTPNYPVKRFYDIVDVFLSKKWERLRDDPTHVTFYNSKKLKKLLNQYFFNVELYTYKEGFLFRKLGYKCLRHKIMVVCKK